MCPCASLPWSLPHPDSELGACLCPNLYLACSLRARAHTARACSCWHWFLNWPCIRLWPWALTLELDLKSTSASASARPEPEPSPAPSFNPNPNPNRTLTEAGPRLSSSPNPRSARSLTPVATFALTIALHTIALPTPLSATLPATLPAHPAHPGLSPCPSCEPLAAILPAGQRKPKRNRP